LALHNAAQGSNKTSQISHNCDALNIAPVFKHNNKTSPQKGFLFSSQTQTHQLFVQSWDLAVFLFEALQSFPIMNSFG